MQPSARETWICSSTPQKQVLPSPLRLSPWELTLLLQTNHIYGELTFTDNQLFQGLIGKNEEGNLRSSRIYYRRTAHYRSGRRRSRPYALFRNGSRLYEPQSPQPDTAALVAIIARKYVQQKFPRPMIGASLSIDPHPCGGGLPTSTSSASILPALPAPTPTDWPPIFAPGRNEQPDINEGISDSAHAFVAVAACLCSALHYLCRP